MQKSRLNNMLCNVCLGVLSFVAFALFVWMCFKSPICVDEREHIQASYLIYNGKVPYRDFFEHHHALIWYLFAPVFYFLDDWSLVYYAIRVFSLIVAMCSAYYIYRIGRILGLDGIKLL